MNLGRIGHIGSGLLMLVAVLSWAFINPGASAQEVPSPLRMQFALGGGYDRGLITGKFPVFAGSSDCGEFTSGVASSPLVRFSVVLPELFTPRLGAAVRFEWAAASESFTAYPVDSQRIYDPIANETVDLDRRYRFESRVPVVRLDLLGVYAMGERSRFGLGGWLGYRLSSAFSQRDTVVGPSGFLYPDGTAGRPMAGGTIPTLQPLAAGMVAAVSYNLPLFGRFSLMPELSARAEFTAPVHEALRQTYTLGFGLALLFDPHSSTSPSHSSPLTPHRKPPVSPSNVVPDGSLPALEAHIDLYSLGIDGARSDSSVISVDESLHRTYMPFLPVVFFDRGSATISPPYVTLTSERIAEFSLESFASLDAIGVNHNALNLIGRRMLANPDAVAVLYGETSGDESSELGNRRAGSVRDYLHDIWGIAKDRLLVRSRGVSMSGGIESTPEGEIENRRVVIASTMAAITAPVVVEKIERTFDPPMIRMKPTIVAGAGIRNWSITIRHAGTQVAHYSNSRPDGDSAGGIAWQIVSDRIDSDAAPLVAELLVEDSTGRIVAARDELALGFTGAAMNAATVTTLERIEYDLAGFQEGSHDLPGEIDGDLDRIAGVIEKGSVVSVTGRTDRRRETNDRLAVERARAVAEGIARRLHGDAAHDLEITIGGDPVAENVANGRPEERMLSRAVHVVVERRSSGNGGDSSRPGGRK